MSVSSVTGCCVATNVVPATTTLAAAFTSVGIPPPPLGVVAVIVALTPSAVGAATAEDTSEPSAAAQAG